jgi:hypothetical protein
VYDAVHALDGLVEDPLLIVVADVVKVADLNEVETTRVLRPRLQHGVRLGLRPRGTTHPDAPGQELIHDMSPDEAGRAGDQNVLSVIGSVTGTSC